MQLQVRPERGAPHPSASISSSVKWVCSWGEGDIRTHQKEGVGERRFKALGKKKRRGPARPYPVPPPRPNLFQLSSP